jgi:hypothetical protein
MPQPADGSEPAISYDNTSIINRTVDAAATGFCPAVPIPGGWLRY